MFNFIFKINKVRFLTIFVFSLLFLTACGDNSAKQDVISYENKDLQFEVVLSNDFKYFQTQRVQTKNFTDIDFFVPTSDQSYGKEVPGYAKPFVVRIFDDVDLSDNSIYEKIGEGNGKTYTIRFWEKIPQDWQNIWSEEMKNELKNNFKIY